MRDFVKTIVFVLGVDCLGFPTFHTHRLIFKEKFYNKFIKYDKIPKNL